MKNSKYLLPFIILLGFILYGCSAYNNVDKKQMDNNLQEQIVNANTEDHGSHDYNEDCEECPPPRITDGIEIDGPGGMNPNWPTESDNPNEWPKNMGDLDTDVQDSEIEDD